MIYFLRHAETGLIKIGKTVGYSVRLSALISMYGDLELVGLMPGYTTEERELHSLFKDDNVRGVLGGREWFRASKKLTKYIGKYSRMILPLPLETEETIRVSPIEPSGQKAFFYNGLPALIRQYQLDNAYPNGDYPAIDTIARRAGIARDTFFRYLHSKINSVNLEVWQKLVDFFNVPGEEIFTVNPSTH